jgi:type II secretory pathway component GspD/PulD (secretin)
MFIGLKRITVAVIFIAVAAFVPRAMGQQVSSPKTLAVIKYDGDMASLLANLGEPYGVTIGFEVDPQHARSQVKFYLREPTLADTLNAIVNSAPAYQWRMSGEVVEVLPAAGGSPLLDTRITYFHVSDLTREEALTQLMNLPESQSVMKETNLSFRATSSAATETSKQKVSVRLEGTTLREALNQIFEAEGGRFWIFRKDSSGSFTISGSPW